MEVSKLEEIKSSQETEQDMENLDSGRRYCFDYLQEQFMEEKGTQAISVNAVESLARDYQ